MRTFLFVSLMALVSLSAPAQALTVEVVGEADNVLACRTGLAIAILVMGVLGSSPRMTEGAA